MQKELEAANPLTKIRLLGVNNPFGTAGNTLVCTGRDLPWLQDTTTEQVQGEWQAVYRDVVILDEDNHPIDVFNLTDHDLNDPAEYAALKALLLQHASE